MIKEEAHMSFWKRLFGTGSGQSSPRSGRARTTGYNTAGEVKYTCPNCGTVSIGRPPMAGAVEDKAFCAGCGKMFDKKSAMSSQPSRSQPTPPRAGQGTPPTIPAARSSTTTTPTAADKGPEKEKSREEVLHDIHKLLMNPFPDSEVVHTTLIGSSAARAREFSRRHKLPPGLAEDIEVARIKAMEAKLLGVDNEPHASAAEAKRMQLRRSLEPVAAKWKRDVEDLVRIAEGL
jgi:predicted RNA-binding Zn-ribbon protein involved in translation (DUF1610 family)